MFGNASVESLVDQAAYLQIENNYTGFGTPRDGIRWQSLDPDVAGLSGTDSQFNMHLRSEQNLSLIESLELPTPILDPALCEYQNRVVIVAYKWRDDCPPDDEDPSCLLEYQAQETVDAMWRVF